MTNDSLYDAVVARAMAHLEMAHEKFCADGTIRWRQMTGNIPLVRERAWIDALKQSLAHHEKLESALGG